VDNELKEIYRKALNYLKAKREKVIGWVLFILGIFLIIIGFSAPGAFILGGILAIIGGVLLRKELKKVASFLKLFFIRASSFGPALAILGFVFNYRRNSSLPPSPSWPFWMGYSFAHYRYSPSNNQSFFKTPRCR